MAGDWAFDAFTGYCTDEPDLEVGIPGRELTMLRRHLAGRLDVWLQMNGAQRPLLPGDAAVTDLAIEPASAASWSTTADQRGPRVWLRLNGAEPWEYDVALADGGPGLWQYGRDPRVRLALCDAVWCDRDVSYLRPEVELLNHAGAHDLAVDRLFHDLVGLLDSSAAAWLRDSLELAHPGHPWLASLARRPRGRRATHRPPCTSR